MTPDELALAGQAVIKELEGAYPDDARISTLHRILTSACIRSAAGQLVTVEGLVALGIDPASPVPADDGPNGPGTGKTPPPGG